MNFKSFFSLTTTVFLFCAISLPASAVQCDTALQTRIQKLKSDMSGLNKTIKDQKSTISSQKNTISSQSTAIKQLENKISRIEKAHKNLLQCCKGKVDDALRKKLNQMNNPF